MELEFTLHRDQVLNINTYKSMHWSIKGVKTKALRLLAEEQEVIPEAPLDKYSIRVVVMPPTKQKMDPVNLYPTVKALIDGLTDSGWWEDDDYRHLIEISFVHGGLSGLKGQFVFKLEITPR